MRLTEHLRTECVKVPLAGKDKAAAIAELVDLLATSNLIADASEVLEAVLEREDRRTTGIGLGLAVPHAKCPAANELVMAVGKPSETIDFQSRDGEPVNLVVLLVSPVDQTGPHIQALARISRLMTIESVRQDIQKAQTAQDLYDIIASQEV